MIDRVLAGRYKIVSAIGEGGMSKVWRANDMNTGKTVAVKVLRDEFQGDETFVRRFEREAQAASRMSHPNIANLLDVGAEEDGTRYLVIEYVSGKTLKQFIQESGAIRPETAAQIIIRVLAAVQHAHQNGVIHRDIKPQNILIDKEGTVKVSDFGIARVANSQTMSQDTDVVMGSVYYFSPEQAKGAAVDEKSDLYSVGVVLYEMLTGQVPFTGDTPVAIAMKHLQETPVPPSEINPAVSPALDFVVLHAMEKRPRNRYASATDMLRDVRLALEHPDTILAARAEAERREHEAKAEERRRERVERRVRWMRRILVGVFTLVLMAAIGLTGYSVMERILIARQSTVEVPDVLGKQQTEAVGILTELGLVPVVGTRTYDLITENIVADQGYAPGTMVEVGSHIPITISVSRYDVRIPSVTNIPYSEAAKLLSNLGLNVETELEVSQAEANLVIRQEPVAGTAANEGDVVHLVISGGAVVMPRLIDFTGPEAAQTLTAFGLTFSDFAEIEVDDPAKVDRVVGQSPAPYREVMRGTTVVVQIGVPADTLYSASITLDLSEMPANTSLSVMVRQPDGTEIQRYGEFFETTPGSLSLDLYSTSSREGVYSVYYSGVLQYIEPVSYTR